MLKILRKGEKTLPEDKTYKMKCKTCGCEYLYQNEDVKYDFYGDFEYLRCPQCDYISYILFKRKYKCESGDKND